MNHDPAAIRRFLIQAFDDEELKDLCLDYFAEVYHDFTTGMAKSQMVRDLIAYCQRRGRIADLVVALERERPAQAKEYFASAAAVEIPTAQRPEPTTQEVGQVAQPASPASGDTIIWPQDGKEMVRVPAGEFLYGEAKETIYLPEFWIDKTPVTNAEYKKFLAANPHHPVPGHGGTAFFNVFDAMFLRSYRWHKPSRSFPPGKKEHPVALVSWYDAVAYAQWAGKRLPTEQEWEKAARGTDGRPYPWGDGWRPGYANTIEAGVDGTTPVGYYSPRGDSPYGCVDMSGNVWEWVDAWFDEEETRRAERGGSWNNEFQAAEVTVRDRSFPNLSGASIGFRLVSARL
jgi:formylglycine-generating enzyme required for sulfatase activity